MKVYIGADHRGFELKQKLVKLLIVQGVEVVDCGADKFDANDDYPQFAQIVARSVAAQNTPTSGDGAVLGIAICGSGIGVCIAANKVTGIRAGTVWTPQIATHVRERDDINVLCLSADNVTNKDNLQIARNFISAEFAKISRDLRRIKMIAQIESCQ